MMRMTKGERIGNACVVGITTLLAFIAIYPFLYTLSMSISDPQHVIRKDIWLLPKGFSLGAYRMVFENKTIWMSYYNTVWYTVIGTAINVLMTVMGAYPLAIRHFRLKKPIMFLIVFTMFFGGGLIPTFMLISNLGLYDTRWVMVIPVAVETWYIIIARTYFLTLPDSLMESARIDGANDVRILFRIVVPLSMPIVAVLVLFYAVGHWNSYFQALVYLRSPELFPLQIFLMRTLILLSQDFANGISLGIVRAMIVEQFKYAAVIVTILPILVVYPFLQRHFVKGILIGAIKE